MWGGVCVTSLFPRDGPIFRDDVLSNPEFQVNLKFANYEIFEAWNELEQEKPSSQKRDMAYWILTESGLEDEFARERKSHIARGSLAKLQGSDALSRYSALLEKVKFSLSIDSFF